MKNNSNSILNKIGDVNSELIKITKKFNSIDSLYEKLENNIKEESSLRQNIEKKTFHMNETLNNKILTLRKGFDDLAQIITEQTENLKLKFMDDIQKNNDKFYKGFEESLKRIETYEKNATNSFTEFTLFKSELSSKVNSLEDNLNKEIREVRKELNNNNLRIDILDKKLNDNLFTLQNDLSELLKEFNYVRNDIEMIKNFKENTILNFKDISEEFVKNEENYHKFINKISFQMQDIERKILQFEQTFNSQNDTFTNIKKDIYSQIYDANLNINNKFQSMNESFFEKQENFEKMFTTFQNSLIDENEKFTVFITEQLDQHNKNIKRIIDVMNEDLDLIKNKVSNF